MKPFICCLLLLIIPFSLFGCYEKETEGKSSLSESSSQANSQPTESEEAPELDLKEATKEYRFLVSPYTVTSKKTSFDTVYECEYYFVNGVVMGIKATTTLPNDEQAELYYESIAEKDPCAYISGNVVINFAYSEDFYFNKYTPEKLYYALNNAGYSVVFNFDLDEFNKIYDESSKA